MNKSDLRGIDKVIREENAIIKIYMDKKLVRKMVVNKEEGKDIIITGSTLKRLLRTASMQLNGKEVQNQVCVGGVPSFDSKLDELLKEFYLIIFKDQVSAVLKMHVNNYDNNMTVLKSEASFKNGVYGLIENVENFLQKKDEKENKI